MLGLLMVLFILHCSATLIVNHYWDSLQYSAGTRGGKSRRVIEAKFILTHWCCSYKVAREQTLWQFHQKLGEFNYGCPTLQMNLVFRALNQNGADRIKVVIVTASERACSCFGHLKGEKQAHNNNSYWERNQHTPQTHTHAERESEEKGREKWGREGIHLYFPFSIFENTIYHALFKELHFLNHIYKKTLRMWTAKCEFWCRNYIYQLQRPLTPAACWNPLYKHVLFNYPQAQEGYFHCCYKLF